MNEPTILAVMDSYDYSYTTTSAANGPDAGVFLALIPVYILFVVVLFVALWKVFSKAGKPGWAALVPFYNAWVLAEIAGKPGWWGLGIILVNLVPFVGPAISLVVSLLISLEIAKKFGKSPVFGVVGLWLFSLIGYLILAFGDAKYQNNTSPAQTSSLKNKPEALSSK